MVASGCLGLNPPTSETTLPTTVLNRMRQTKGLTRCRSLTGGQGLCERIEKLIDGVRGCTELVDGVLKQVAMSPPFSHPATTWRRLSQCLTSASAGLGAGRSTVSVSCCASGGLVGASSTSVPASRQSGWAPEAGDRVMSETVANVLPCRFDGVSMTGSRDRAVGVRRGYCGTTWTSVITVDNHEATASASPSPMEARSGLRSGSLRRRRRMGAQDSASGRRHPQRHPSSRGRPATEWSSGFPRRPSMAPRKRSGSWRRS